MLKGYRGILREFARTGTWRALWLQIETGTTHVVRQLRGRRAADPIATFFESYGADGFRPHDAAAAAVQLDAEACLVCGLCTVECARVGGVPPIDPRDAVVASARLTIDWSRLGRAVRFTDDTQQACAGCRACERACPAGIPIARIVDGVAALER